MKIKSVYHRATESTEEIPLTYSVSSVPLWFKLFGFFETPRLVRLADRKWLGSRANAGV
jgi:hypothetical protein